MATTTVTIHPDFKAFASLDDARFRIRNLAKLALWTHHNADEIKDTFKMDRYLGRDIPGDDEIDDSTEVECYDISVKTEHPCGTCACFAGHGPMAGVGLEAIKEIREVASKFKSKGDDWYEYVDMVFVPLHRSGFLNLYGYLFGPCEGHPDCPETAARRVQALFNGCGRDEFCHRVATGNVFDEIDEDFLSNVAAGIFELKTLQWKDISLDHKPWHQPV